MSDILWRRLRYSMTPQFDLYRSIGERVKNLDVLEIGFGTGFGTLQLVGGAHFVEAVDVDKDAVAFARLAYPFSDVRWSEGDATTLRLPAPLSFHAAVMVEVLEHIVDYGMALTSVANALLTGGRLYITSRNANADLRRNELHTHERTAQEFKADLRRHFRSVVLFDYSLTFEQADDTRLTPLIAVATK